MASEVFLESTVSLFLSESNQLHPGYYFLPNNEKNLKYYLGNYFKNSIDKSGNQPNCIYIIWLQLHDKSLVLVSFLEPSTQYPKIPQPESHTENNNFTRLFAY